MEHRTIETAPQVYARVGGCLYLVIIVAGGFAEGFVRNRLVIFGDADATARNIAASPALWHLSIAAELLTVFLALALALVEYGLLKPVNRYIASLALGTNLVSITLEAVNKILLLVASSILASGSSFDAFRPEQRDALAYLVLKAHGVGFHVSLLVFGVVCLLLGYLLFKSGYFPKVLGILLQIAGAGYLTASISALFFPSFEDLLFPYILIPPFIGELSLCLWLLVKGVDLPKWRQRIDAASSATST